jgi:hypothetical protein
MPLSTDELVALLDHVADLLEENGIWYCLAWGTLLGAVRDGDVIAWEKDVDLLVRPSDRTRILELESELDGKRVTFEPIRCGPARLAANWGAVPWFDPGFIGATWGGEKYVDLYMPQLFNDGVLRTYDFETETFWTPHLSFPHFFVERTATARIRGRSFPIPRDVEKFLEGVYGHDWRVPYRAVLEGGEARAGTNVHGSRYAPKLAEEIEWCVARGWDRSRYEGQPRWPRATRAAGPIGESPRTIDSTRALWWRDLSELQANY